VPLDFAKLGGPNPADTVIDPRQLFSALAKKGRRFAYPRDVQAEVWTQWYDRRNDRDLVLKMNTGSGKTVVGLVILKSCLNEGIGPAVYVTPDRFLVRQVMTEAADLSIPTCDDPRDPAFLSSQAVLVTTIFKLINGRSVFGTSDSGIKIPIGSIVVDDAHACLNTTEEQFTIRLLSNTQAYKQIIQLFEEDLRRQSSAGALEVLAEDPTKVMLIPFWTWRRNVDKVAGILHAERDTDGLRFSWPLLKDSLPITDAAVGRGMAEISTRCLPVDVIPSFAAARRRVFLTATLADDSVLVTTFDVSDEAARSPVTPGNASDLGERLIITPHELNPDMTDQDLKDLVADVAKRVNVVVIVPSHARAEFWKDRASATLSAANIEEGIAALKERHEGLVVVVNRYDGIDLADEACRMLVLDGLPLVRRSIDMIDQAVLYGTEEQLAKTTQRIEQGMGRAIRSAEDWCIVLLSGRSLTDHLYNQRALSMLTPGTRAQWTLSRQVVDQLRGAPTSDLLAAISQVIERDSNWVRASKAALVGVQYDRSGKVSPIALAQRAAFNAARAGNWRRAIDVIQDACNSAADRRTRGWLKEQLAKAVDFVNEIEAQRILLSAASDNTLVTKPISGVGYHRIQTPSKEQALNIVSAIADAGYDYNGFLVRTDALLEDLQFEPDTAPVFERSLFEVAGLLGLGAQRPEADGGVGPDILIALGDQSFLVIECKNGAVSNSVSKRDANQLAGSLNWFNETYGSQSTAIPVLLHPSASFDASATPPPGTRVVDRERLERLRGSVHSLARGIGVGQWPPDQEVVARLLDETGLAAGAIAQSFAVPAKKRR
jgi:hypothetical protein